MKLVFQAVAAISTICIALALPTDETISRPRTLLINNTSTSLGEPLNLPIDPFIRRDITVATNFGSQTYRIKGGQLLHTIYSLVEGLWHLADSPVINSPSVYHGPAFWNIGIIVTPTPFQSRRSLTVVMVQFALYTIAETLLGRSRWPSSIAARVKDWDTTQVLGLVDITDALNIDRSDIPKNYSSAANGSYHPINLNDQAANTSTNLTTSIGEGLPPCPLNLPTCRTRPCRPLCSHLTTSWPISDWTWLKLFHTFISRCFTIDQSEPIRDRVSPSRTWTVTDAPRAVEMKLEFYDPALDPHRPMLFRELVAGLLRILEQWARKNEWKTGWGLIERDGVPEASLVIQYITEGEGVVEVG